MVVQLCYSCGRESILIEMTDFDGEVRRVLHERSAPDSERVFRVLARGAPRSIPADELSGAADRLSLLLATDSRLSCFFGLSFQIVPGYWVRDAENASSVMVDGKLHHIEAGLGRCELRELIVQANGTAIPGQARDISSFSQLDTENYGTITITRSRRDTSGMRMRLHEVGEFAKRHHGTEIVVERVDETTTKRRSRRRRR